MPVDDVAPRYRLVDPDTGDIIGSVYAEADGTLKLQEGSGSNNEAVLGPDGTLSVPAVSTDKLNSELWFDPSMSVADIQAEIDAAGSGTVAHFETGAYTWDGNLKLYDDTVVHIEGCQVTFADGQADAMFENVNTDQGNDNIVILAHGSDFDGNGSTVSENQEGVLIQGGDADATNTDYYCHNIAVLGGHWHDFYRTGVQLVRCIGFRADISQAARNGKTGDSGDKGDGIKVTMSKDGHIHADNAHDNERGGLVCQGENPGTRCVNIKMSGNTSGNGAEGFGPFGVQDVTIDGTSRNDNRGVKGTGTGRISVTVDNSTEAGIEWRTKDYPATTSDITGETDNRYDTVYEGCSVRNPGDHAFELYNTVDSGIGVHKLLSPTVREASGIGILMADDGRLEITDPDIIGVDTQAVNLGNDDNIEGSTVSGGFINDWDRSAGDNNAITTGPNFGNAVTVSGVSFGTTYGGSNLAAIAIRAGDYHSVTGNATQGNSISVNGSNSTTAANN